MAPDRPAHVAARRRLWAVMFLFEFLFFSGPFGLPMLQVAWCEAHGLPVPDQFPYVGWLLGLGIALLAGMLVYDIARRVRDAASRSR